MTNMDFYKDAVGLLNTGASLGIHWTLSCGKPVLSSSEIPTLVAKNGEFYPYKEFRKRYREHKISNEEIKRELVAQYQRYKELLGEPDYWNTHQNVHVDMEIFQVLVDVESSLSITKMRSHQRIYVPASTSQGKRTLKWRIMEPVKTRVLASWLRNARKLGMEFPDGCVVRLREDDTNNIEYVFSNISWKNNTVGEVIIHPATHCDSSYFGKVVEQRVLEYELYTSKKTKELIESNGIRLVNFKEL